MGQQGKFLLNKASYSMPWKFHLVNTNDYRNILYKSFIIAGILEFFFKNNIYIYIFKKKNIFLKKSLILEEQNFVIELYSHEAKKFSKKIFYSQTSILYYNSWFFIKIFSYTIAKPRKVKKKRVFESYLRLRHLFYYLTPKSDIF